MNIWIKASVISFAIALTILFFQSYWFLDGKDIGKVDQNSAIHNKQSPEPKSIKLLKDSLFMSTIPKNYSNFALQLSATYADLGILDSAARYKTLSNTGFSNEKNDIN